MRVAILGLVLALAGPVSAAPPAPAAGTAGLHAGDGRTEGQADREGGRAGKKKPGWRVTVQPIMQMRLTVQKDPPNPELRLRRARLRTTARYKKLLKVRLTADIGDFRLKLKSNYLEVRALKRWLFVRAGYFKRPLLRSYLTSRTVIGGAERTFHVKLMQAARDLGFMLHNQVKRDGGLRYALSLTSDLDLDAWLTTRVATFHAVVAARVGYEMAGLQGYVEHDLENAKRSQRGFRAGGAASVVWFSQDKSLRWNVDGIAKYRGAVLAVELFGRSGPEYEHESLGLYTHAGYQIVAPLEAFVRWAGVFPKNGGALHELTGGLSSAVFENHLRVVAEGAWLQTPVPGAGAVPPQDSWRFRLLLQAQ